MSKKRKNSQKRNQKPIPTKKLRSNNPSLSLCMIIKDEEKRLPVCLKSVRDYVDEIIIVDTGSTDRSPQIAKEYGAKVFLRLWEKDFSKHRNQSISYAKGDWILILDADEELVEPSGEILRKAILDETIDSIAMQVINPFNNGKARAVFNSIRAFKNNQTIKYEGIVHNKEVGCNSTKFYPIQILHHGYNLNDDRMREKFSRTTSLLKIQIAKEPTNPLLHHYLSASYLSMGAFDNKYYHSAIKDSTLAIKLAQEQGDNDQIYLCSHYIAAASYLNLGKTAEAEAICKKALDIFPDHLDSYYLLAKIYDRTAISDSAKHCAERYNEIRDRMIKQPGEFGKIINNSFWGKWFVSIILGKAEFERGNHEKADEIFKLTSQKSTANLGANRLIGEFYLSKGEFHKAVYYLKEAVKNDKDKLLLYMLLECYGQLWEVDNQIRVLSDIIDEFPNELGNIKQIGMIQFERGNYRLASFCLEKVVENGDRSHEIIEKLKTARSYLDEQRQFKNRGTGSRRGISACLMVKDEEDCIERCLKSIKPFVDEIILVDTGSTDRTIEIALSHGAKVYHHPWEEDFSKHRNQSMSYAKSDWILVIDADEVLDPDSGKKMLEIARNSSKNAILFKVIDSSHKGDIRSMFSSPRLFKNGMGCHYRGTVHNQPHYPGEAEPALLNIIHYGYDLSPEKMEAKTKRTVSLLMRQIEQNPNAPFPRFNLAVSRYGAKDFQGAIDAGEIAIKLLRLNGIKEPGYASIFYIVSMAYNHLKQADKAQKIAQDGLDYYQENLDALYALAIINYEKNNYRKTIEYGHRYLNLFMKISDSEAMLDMEYKSLGEMWQVLLALSYANYISDHHENALKYFNQACDMTSLDTFPLIERKKFYSIIGQQNISLNILNKMVAQ